MKIDLTSQTIVADFFWSFRRDVISPDAPAVQVNEMGKAFYAGASAVLFALMEITDKPDDAGVDLIDRLYRECHAFAQAPDVDAPAPVPDINFTTPDPDDIRTLLNDLGGRLKNDVPAGYGFALLIFEFAGPNLFYLSSADRADMIKAMREFITRATQ